MLLKHRVFYPLMVVLLVFSLTACDFIQRPDYEAVDPIPSLWKEYKEYFPIGVAVNGMTINTHSDLIEKHFLSITAENEMKPERFLRGISPNGELILDFSSGDMILDYARKNEKMVRGHVLVWHSQTPVWFFQDENGENLTPEALLERMEEYIKEVVGHYKGQFYAWDVVNEVISDSEENPNEIFRINSRWNQIFAGREIDYIEAAFRAAHEADPEAKLYYNDYSAVNPTKRDKIIYMLKELQARDVPIDGVGIQAHWAFDWPSAELIEEAIIAYSELGLDIQITELDIRKYSQDMYRRVALSTADLKKQAERYKEVFEVFIKHSDKISSVTIWGVTDDYSWIPQDPLIFDRNKNPKPAFWAILDALGK